MSALRIDVADLLTHPGARRPLHLETAVADLGTPVARIVEPVRLDLVLERVPDGIVARGELHARWEAECSNCLRELAADLDVGVGELFEPHPLDEDTYPIEGHEIDLEQLVREVAKYGGDVSGMVPPKVAKRLKERFAEQSEGGDP